MTKVFVLSTVLGLGALGMACGDTATNGTNNTVKPVNTATVAPVNTATPATTNVAPANNSAMAPNANAPKSNIGTTMTPAANAPKAVNVAPAPNATKQP